MAGELRTEFLMDVHATLNEQTYPVGDGGRGARTVVTVSGGTFQGPHLRGTIEPLGGDWLVRRTDDVFELDVRALFRTDDGAVIHVSQRGYQHQQSLGPLGELPESERYFRTRPVFETGDERYTWLNRIVAIGVGMPPEPGGVAYRIYAVL